MLVAETLSPRQLAPRVVVGGVHLHQASNPVQNKLRLGDTHSLCKVADTGNLGGFLSLSSDLAAFSLLPLSPLGTKLAVDLNLNVKSSCGKITEIIQGNVAHKCTLAYPKSQSTDNRD